MSKMIKNNCNCANSHMLFTELMTRKNSEDANGYDFVDKPYAVIKYIHTCAWFQKELLGSQLLEVDPLTEPEKGVKMLRIHEKGDSYSLSLFFKKCFSGHHSHEISISDRRPGV